MTNTTRREFAQGVLTFIGGVAFPFDLFADAGSPALRFGAITDVHIGGRGTAKANLEKTLRWLSTQAIDAVVCTGDIAHTGLIQELEPFAEVWRQAFPGGKSPDGRKVELMIATGNHDVDGYSGRWKGFSEEKLRACRITHRDNPERLWQRLFNDKWELIWRKEVKGYTFIGSQWQSLNPPIEAYMQEHADTLKGTKPFFYCQHAVPRGTCGDPGSSDTGASTRALTPFPNAVAISGHSHLTPASELIVWQGAFTSIGSGCLHEGGCPFSNYENASAFWHPTFKQRKMAPIGDPLAWGGDPSGACFMLYEVYDDHLVVHRRSVPYECPIGPAFVISIPARPGGPFDLKRRAAASQPPQFPVQAEVVVKACPDGHPLAGKSFEGKPCVYVTFPHAKSVAGGGRVYDYVVVAEAAGKKITREILAAGYCRPEAFADLPGECIFLQDELPAVQDTRYTVTPRDCFGNAGVSIKS